MLNFLSILPFLPIEYRRKICHSVITTYGIMMAELGQWEEADYKQVAQLNTMIEIYSINRLEAYGETNTRIDPFLIDAYPRH